jgi:hypothetical protein
MTEASELRLSLLGLPRARRLGRSRGRRILFAGKLGTGDIGDDVLLAEALRVLGGDAEPRVMSRNPRLVEGVHGVRAVPVSVRTLLSSLFWCDAAVVVGEPLTGPGLPVLVAACLASRREAVYLTAETEPGTSRSVRRLRRFTGEHGARIIACHEVFERLPPASAECARGALAAAGVPGGQPLLLLAPKAMPDESRTLAQVRALAEAARAWDRHGGVVGGLAMSTHAAFGFARVRRDDAVLGEVSAQLGRDLPVVGPLLPPALAKAVVGQADAMIGARLPALAFAIAQDVASLGFGWEEQTVALLSRHRRPVLPERPLPGQATLWVDQFRTANPRLRVRAT